MDSIRITKRAARTIRDESLACDVETGGRLVGYPQSWLIDTATGPGPNAKHHAVSFSDDVAHQQIVISDLVRESDGRRKQLGEWHRHPGRSISPSTGDHLQARAIARDYESHSGACPLIVIITGVDSQADRNRVVYQAHTFDGRRNRLVKAPLALVADDDPCVIAARLAEPPTIVLKNGTNFFADLGFVFQETPVGNDRLNTEIAKLREAGFGVEVSRRKDDNRIVLFVSDSEDRGVFVIPPPEYPLNPPRLFELPEGNEWDASLCSAILQWSSERTILEVVRGWQEERSLTAVLS